MILQRISLVLCIVAVLSLGCLSAKGWQVSHGELAVRLDEIQKKEDIASIDRAVIAERVQNIEKQIETLNSEKVNERLVRMESSSEANLWFLRAILIPLAFLCLERLLAHSGVLGKKA